MKEIEIIRYLLDEIEEQIRYNEDYKREINEAQERYKKEHGDDGKAWYSYYSYMSEPYISGKSPVKSVVQNNAKEIRRLALKLYEYEF